MSKIPQEYSDTTKLIYAPIVDETLKRINDQWDRMLDESMKASGQYVWLTVPPISGYTTEQLKRPGIETLRKALEK